MGSSCQDDADALSYSCAPNAPSVKQANDLDGIVYFNNTEQRYAIVHWIPGTIDSQDVGFVCTLPENLQQDGQRVVFSGTYRAYTGNAPSGPVGQTYYYLDLRQVEAE
jgi:hypothetical protein